MPEFPNSDKPHVCEVIAVEGRYDRHAVLAAVDAVVVETSGFGLFNDKEKLALLGRMAQTRGLVVFTDSDGAGFLIRNRIKGAIDPSLVKHAYIPDVEGRERRKKMPSKEGKLGVEGMSADIIIDALRRAGASIDGTANTPGPRRVTKADLYATGLSGGPDSAVRRRELYKRAGLPECLSPNALIDVLNALYGFEGFEALVGGM